MRDQEAEHARHDYAGAADGEQDAPQPRERRIDLGQRAADLDGLALVPGASQHAKVHAVCGDVVEVGVVRRVRDGDVRVSHGHRRLLVGGRRDDTAALVDHLEKRVRRAKGIGLGATAPAPAVIAVARAAARQAGCIPDCLFARLQRAVDLAAQPVLRPVIRDDRDDDHSRSDEQSGEDGELCAQAHDAAARAM